MQVQCGDHSRNIRMDVLDRDMFDPHPMTPQHTSWTMALLRRLDAALGDSVLDQPAFTLSEPAERPVPELKSDALLDDLGQGKFDTLFDKAPDKLSELFRQARNPPPQPTVELVSSSPFRPISLSPVGYPTLAKLTHTGGQVTFTVEVTADGGVSNFKILSGHPLLQKQVEAIVAGSRFPTEAAGQEIRATIEFKMNCPSVQR